ncbi:MAG TPA: FAD-linked oxidase C-terminal domain-containing protein [Polyangiaceae bacterium]|nr:FAD-linked oxidase C-terminal domain-containing protein [Polyangiaceae bacterium]
MNDVRDLGIISEVPEGYFRDCANWVPVGQPRGLARPKSTEELQALARWATRHGVPLVPRGAGTGVAGGANAVDGCLIVSFERMNSILELNEAGMYAVVEPGVLNVELKNAARERGLWYAPDPASYEISTLGGNVATNAGGLCCVKYGVTGDSVLGLEAVLASGELLKTGGFCRKNKAGYDLSRLLVGSEGTLAMISKIVLRLRRLPPSPGTLVALFRSLEAAGTAAANIVRTVEPSLLEIMDRAALVAVENYARLGIEHDAGAMLLAQSDAGGATELELMQRACEAAGAQLVYATEEREEGELLLRARRLAYPALERLGQVLIDDISVPLPRLAEMFRRIEQVATRQEVLVATVAHAGDGNIHPLIVFDAKDELSSGRARAVFAELMAISLELGGTITGEHGIGSLKPEFLEGQLGPVSLSLHQGIKQAFDPQGILNPGKVLRRG